MIRHVFDVNRSHREVIFIENSRVCIKDPVGVRVPKFLGFGVGHQADEYGGAPARPDG